MGRLRSFVEHLIVILVTHAHVILTPGETEPGRTLQAIVAVVYERHFR